MLHQCTANQRSGVGSCNGKGGSNPLLAPSQSLNGFVATVILIKRVRVMLYCARAYTCLPASPALGPEFVGTLQRSLGSVGKGVARVRRSPGLRCDTAVLLPKPALLIGATNSALSTQPRHCGYQLQRPTIVYLDCWLVTV